MSKHMSRREFLIFAGQAGALLAGAGVVRSMGQRPSEVSTASRRRLGNPDIVAVARGDLLSKGEREAKAMMQACLKPLGGMKTFVKPGNRVVIKPNVGWMRTPEQAANTNPLLVGALVAICRDSGATEVVVFDHTCDTPAEMCFSMSGIAEAAGKAGARWESGHEQSGYRQVSLDRGKVLTTAEVHRLVLDADVLINMPIAKVHNATGLTLGMKNFMGVVWNRGDWHNSSSLDQCIADFTASYPATLTIIDAQRILLTNGPKGPGRTEDKHTIVAGVDPVAVDAYGATLFGMNPANVLHIANADRVGAGKMDLKKVRIVKVS
jgi:uncharacterized protein (DUF362 family)